MQAEAEAKQIIEQMHAATATQSKMTSEELARVNQELASKDHALVAQGAVLQGEVKRRQDAEKRAGTVVRNVGWGSP